MNVNDLFNKDFYPTPKPVIEYMLKGVDIEDKVILEPSAGSGNIVKYCLDNFARDVIACEINDNLKKILSSLCNVIEDDFFNVDSTMVSHVDAIIMNPPFSSDEKHILHAWEIAPPGCYIISLCNHNTVNNTFVSKGRETIKQLITDHGNYENMGDCFSTAERKTYTDIGLIKLQKPVSNYDTEFNGFFLEDEPDGANVSGIMKYDFIRDLVNRYVGAIKIFDNQLDEAVKMNRLTSGFYYSKLAFSINEDDRPKSRNEFKKDLQKAAWMYIFDKLNLKKYMTKGVKEDINKFVETQTHVPFTMKNIYWMLQVIIGTYPQKMDQAISEVFDRLTKHTDENRYSVEGWKTNSFYLFNKKFIMPYMCPQDRWSKGDQRIDNIHGSSFDLIEDLVKALCYITGKDYNDCQTLSNRIRCQVIIIDKVTSKPVFRDYGNGKIMLSYSSIQDAQKNSYEYKDKIVDIVDQGSALYGLKFDWGFFQCVAYKKGTMHFWFKDLDVWGKLNQNIARIKGYPLYEHKKSA